MDEPITATAEDEIPLELALLGGGLAAVIVGKLFGSGFLRFVGWIAALAGGVMLARKQL